MNEIIELGEMEEVPKICSGKYSYPPYCCVCHSLKQDSSTTTKWRVGFHTLGKTSTATSLPL